MRNVASEAESHDRISRLEHRVPATKCRAESLHGLGNNLSLGLVEHRWVNHLQELPHPLECCDQLARWRDRSTAASPTAQRCGSFLDERTQPSGEFS